MSHLGNGWKHKAHVTDLGREETVQCAPRSCQPWGIEGRQSPTHKAMEWRWEDEVLAALYLGQGVQGVKITKAVRNHLWIREVQGFESCLNEPRPIQLCNVAVKSWKRIDKDSKSRSAGAVGGLSRKLVNSLAEHSLNQSTGGLTGESERWAGESQAPSRTI